MENRVKLEIPDNIYKKYQDELGSLGQALPKFYGNAIEFLIKELKSQQSVVGALQEKISEAKEEAKVEGKKSAIADAIITLKKAGFRIKVTAEE